MRKTVNFLSLLLVFTLLLSSCTFLKKASLNQGCEVYSDIEMAYTDKSEMSVDINVFKRTVAGFLNYLDAGDKEGLKRLLSEALLTSDGIDEELDELFEGFKGHIVETSYIASDTYAGLPGWYEDDFYVNTDKESYYIYLLVISEENKYYDNGDELVGINQIQIMTLDKRYEVEIDKTEFWDFIHTHDGGAGKKGDHYDLIYTFKDGEVKTVRVDRLIGVDCFVVTSFGNSEGYIWVNALQKPNKCYVWKLTGTTDSISAEELEDVDFSDIETVNEVFGELEPYAMPDETYYHDREFRFYNLPDIDSSKKVYVFYGTDSTVPRVRIFDLDKIFVDQDF